MTRRSVLLWLSAAAAGAQQFDSFADALRGGKEFYQAGKYEQARAAFAVAFSRAGTPKESAQATAYLGRALGKMGKTWEAIEYMERSLEFFHYDQVGEELKELQLVFASKTPTSEEITAALQDQVKSNRGTRVMPRRPLALSIGFEFDKAALTPKGFELVSRLGASLANFAGEQVSIVGHTDLIGDPKYNQGLSERRAGTVADEIVKQYRFPRGKLLVSGMGMRQPKYPGTDDESSRLNRRVEVTILGA
jgi:outer membrane protein OmpA-like peptidoglycan-associated protein